MFLRIQMNKNRLSAIQIGLDGKKDLGPIKEYEENFFQKLVAHGYYSSRSRDTFLLSTERPY